MLLLASHPFISDIWSLQPATREPQQSPPPIHTHTYTQLKASPLREARKIYKASQQKKHDRMKIWLPQRRDETNAERQQIKGCTVSWTATSLGHLDWKWQPWGFRGDTLLTYPSRDTESACGWAWSEPFLSLPCRTAMPLWGPSRMMPGRRSAGRLSSWHRLPIDGRRSGQKETYSLTAIKMEGSCCTAPSGSTSIKTCEARGQLL